MGFINSKSILQSRKQQEFNVNFNVDIHFMSECANKGAALNAELGFSFGVLRFKILNAIYHLIDCRICYFCF